MWAIGQVRVWKYSFPLKLALFRSLFEGTEEPYYHVVFLLINEILNTEIDIRQNFIIRWI